MGCVFSRNREVFWTVCKGQVFCEAEARCLLRHESYVDVRARQDIEFASGVEWNKFLLLSHIYLSKMWFLGQDSLVAL